MGAAACDIYVLNNSLNNLLRDANIEILNNVLNNSANNILRDAEINVLSITDNVILVSVEDNVIQLNVLSAPITVID